MNVETFAAIDQDAFAKAGTFIKKFSAGDTIDLNACNEVAAVLRTARTHDGFVALCEVDQLRLRNAAANVRAKFGKDQAKLLNFLDQAYGAMRKPERLQPTQRQLISAFLLDVASAT